MWKIPHNLLQLGRIALPGPGHMRDPQPPRRRAPTSLGVAAILGADPHARLRPKRRRKAPMAHAPLADLAILRERRRETREWYTEASEAFRGGDWDVDFPPGTFRPLGGYVGVHFGLGASSDYFD